MQLNAEMKAVVKNAPYLSLITLNADGAPHPIIVGGKELDGENIAIGIYKMEITQKNLAADPRAWIMASTINGQEIKGYRFAGTAKVAGKKVVFTPDTAEAMI